MKGRGQGLSPQGLADVPAACSTILYCTVYVRLPGMFSVLWGF